METGTVPGVAGGVKKEEAALPPPLESGGPLGPLGLKTEPLGPLGSLPPVGFVPPPLGHSIPLVSGELPLEPKREPLDAVPAPSSAFGAPPRASPSKTLPTPRVSPRPLDEQAPNVFVKQESQARR